MAHCSARGGSIPPRLRSAPLTVLCPGPRLPARPRWAREVGKATGCRQRLARDGTFAAECKKFDSKKTADTQRKKGKEKWHYCGTNWHYFRRSLSPISKACHDLGRRRVAGSATFWCSYAYDGCDFKRKVEGLEPLYAVEPAR